MAEQNNERRPRERRRGRYPKEFRGDASASSINRFSLPPALHIKVPNHGPLFRALLSTHLSGSDGERMSQNERTDPNYTNTAGPNTITVDVHRMTAAFAALAELRIQLPANLYGPSSC